MYFVSLELHRTACLFIPQEVLTYINVDLNFGFIKHPDMFPII